MTDDNEENLPAPIIDDLEVVIPEPDDVIEGDITNMVAKKHLPMLNGMLKACHLSFARITTVRGLGHAIDNTLKVMKFQRLTVGIKDAPRGYDPKGNPVPVLPD